MLLGQTPGDGRPYLVVDILGVKIPGLLDSGSNRTILGSKGWSLLESTGLQILPYRLQSVTTASGEQCRIGGAVNLIMELEGRSKWVEVLYVPSIQTPLVLGLDFWQHMEIVPDLTKGSWVFSKVNDLKVASLMSPTAIHARDNLPPSDRQRLDVLVAESFELFSKSPGCTSLIEHEIDTGDAQPIKQRYYPVSPAIQKIINTELEQMLSDGIVEPSG